MRTFDFNNLPSDGEIDLRKEAIKIIYGDGVRSPKGGWTVFRKSNTSSRSPYWNDERQESIGGPPWNWNDYLIRARMSSIKSGEAQEVRDVFALIETPIVTFYMDYRMRPKKEDYILTINNFAAMDPPSVFTVTAKYDILLVRDPRDKFGRVEYYICYCKKSVSRGDRTLDNIDIKEIIR